ncbi:MAG: DUF1905 domain-containing protein [Gemmatimonadaceae bacterium]|jgi:hypothetical protein|nr:DUF1905 domain-containing protein [Gemmatimonadaceae bacterium]
MLRVRFRATLWRSPGKGGWHFVDVPPRCAPSRHGAWGRAPVTATVNGSTWKTSAWRGENRRVLLPLPKRIRGALEEGDRVWVTLEFT